MKIQKVYRWFNLLLFTTMVTGCSSLTKDIATPSLGAPTLQPTASSTPNPTVMPIVIPTLPAEDARERLLELLANNGGCRLPCIWGITAGKSNYEEARSILIPLSSIAETAYFDTPYPEDDIAPLYIEGDLRLNVRVLYLYGTDDVISLITFRALEEKVVSDANGNWISKQPIFDSTTFIRRVEYYSLFHVLTEQGIPPSVMIATSGLTDLVVAGGLDIALLYPEQGIWINYTMPMYNNGKTKRGCPANAHIEMSLFPSGNPESFFSLLEKTDWGRIKGGYKPLDEATTMSIEKFYETFRNPTDQCIETPTNLWLTSEP